MSSIDHTAKKNVPMRHSVADNPTDNGKTGPPIKGPRWVGYVVTLVLEAALTAGLLLIAPYFPLGNFPITYVILIMAVAYLFGEGPAILAFFTGLLVFDYFFVPPFHTILPHPNDPMGWTRLAAFLLGTSVVGFATLMMRRSKKRIERLADELKQQRALLDTFARNVPVGLALHGRDTRYIIANQALAPMVNRQLNEIENKTVWEVLPEYLARDAAAAIEKVFTTGEPLAWHDLTTNLDIERCFDIDYYPIRASSNEVIGVGVVVVEITERVAAHRKLEQIYEREHYIAETLQMSLMGSVPERIDDLKFDTQYRAALEEARVGGDFYDVFNISDDETVIVIGDVSGKGLRAAAQLALVKYSIRGRAYDCNSPAIIVDQVNKTLVRDVDLESFITLFVGVLNRRDRTLTYVNAGHSPTFLWEAAKKQAIEIEPTGPLMGVAMEAVYKEHVIHLDSGDEILLGTDGLIEIRCKADYLQSEGLMELYTDLKRSHDMSARKLVERVIEYCDGELRDDLAILRISV